MGAKKKIGAEMKIESDGQPYEVGEKRFYMPGTIISGSCPKCGEAYEEDLEDNYLSYPTANEPFDQNCYCGKCEHEWQRRREQRSDPHPPRPR